MKLSESLKNQSAGAKTGTAPVPTIYPEIVSASRATDIPAFHARWFMERLRAGHVLWINPFNPAQRRRVSFEKCRLIVFWTKNPAPLIPFLEEIKNLGHEFYFQYTLNDYEAEGFEPGVPPLAERVGTFQRLSRLIGKKRLIWRYDPIILGGALTVETQLARIGALARRLAPCTEKLVFSFLDMYKKTQRNLARAAPEARPPDQPERRAILEGLSSICAGLEYPLAVSACAEEIDPPVAGITHSACIDSELANRLCGILGKSGGASQGELLPSPKNAPRDKGQRKGCHCAPAKDIGRYNTCPHFCVYCYANQSEDAVRKNLARGVMVKY